MCMHWRIRWPKVCRESRGPWNPTITHWFSGIRGSNDKLYFVSLFFAEESGSSFIVDFDSIVWELHPSSAADPGLDRFIGLRENSLFARWIILSFARSSSRLFRNSLTSTTSSYTDWENFLSLCVDENSSLRAGLLQQSLVPFCPFPLYFLSFGGELPYVAAAEDALPLLAKLRWGKLPDMVALSVVTASKSIIRSRCQKHSSTLELKTEECENESESLFTDFGHFKKSKKPKTSQKKYPNSLMKVEEVRWCHQLTCQINIRLCTGAVSLSLCKRWKELCGEFRKPNWKRNGQHSCRWGFSRAINRSSRLESLRIAVNSIGKRHFWFVIN